MIDEDRSPLIILKEEEDPRALILKESRGGSCGGGALRVPSTTMDKFTLSSSVSSCLSTDAVTWISAGQAVPTAKIKNADSHKKSPTTQVSLFWDRVDRVLPVLIMVRKHIFHLALHLTPGDFF